MEETQDITLRAGFGRKRSPYVELYGDGWEGQTREIGKVMLDSGVDSIITYV